MQRVALFRVSAWLGHCTLGKFTVLILLRTPENINGIWWRTEPAIDLIAVNRYADTDLHPHINYSDEVQRYPMYAGAK